MKITLKFFLLLLGLILFTFTGYSFSKDKLPSIYKVEQEIDSVPEVCKLPVSVFDSLSLADKGLSRDAYEYAMKGFEALKEKGKLRNDSVITIVDFDQPSYKKRMYIIDIKNYKILFNTWTAHGRNSGAAEAKVFSNVPESYQSSLGLYVTDMTYSGKHGYSLRLVGLEKINNNALNRAIVLHGAKYVSQETINAMGYIGRSHGCPAVPVELSKPIIDKIKDGTCFFIYNSAYKNLS